MDKKHNAADEKLVEEKEKEVALERTQELEDIRFLLRTPAGVRFFKSLLMENWLFTSTYTGTSATYFREGQRSIALKVFGDVVEAAPEKITEIITEQKEGKQCQKL